MQSIRAKKNLKTCEGKSPKGNEQKMDRKQAILEIKRLAEGNVIPILIFPNIGEMKIFMEDAKLGTQIRYGLKQFNIPLEKEWMQ